MSTNLIGQTLLNQFRVDAFIDAGGMGAVYRAWDLKRNVPMAMKILHADLMEEPSLLKRFQREARALKKLAHPNVVPFYGMYQALGLTFLLEGFVDGPSLSAILKRRAGKPMPIEEALAYLKALSAALGYAHINGVVHCDVKPGNVMVDRGGQIYLTDFGVARHAESTTTTLGFAGTPAYMAPEQVMGKPVMPATDVYALGVLLFEMLTGRRPFTGEEKGTEKAGSTLSERIRYAHRKLQPPDPHQINPALSEGLAKVILKALKKPPTNRYNSVQAFYVAVCKAAGFAPDSVPDRVMLPGRAVSQFPIGPANGRGLTSTPAPRQMLPWLVGGIGVLVLTIVALAITTIYWVFREGKTSTGQSNPVMAASAAISAAKTPSPAFPSISPPTLTSHPTQILTPEPRAFWRPIPNCPLSRLDVGDWTWVDYTPPLCNRIREQPDVDKGAILDCVDPGTSLKVIDGPVCHNGWIWWKVRVRNTGLVGWTAEGDGKEFWLEAGRLSAP